MVLHEPSSTSGTTQSLNGSNTTQAQELSPPKKIATLPTASSPPTAPWSVQAVVSALPPTPANLPTPLPFLHLLERLKTTPREGWRRFHIPNGESIADHMYRMSILTMLAPPSLASRLDIARCTKMALVHDMAESLVGDITPRDGISKTEKSRREAATMDYLTGSELLGGGGGEEEGVENSIGQGLRAVWQEYEDGITPESKFVHDIDKLELVLQMMEYERRAEPKGSVDLGEFVWVAGRIELEEMRIWCAAVLREREEFWKGLGREGEVQGWEMGRSFVEGWEREREGKMKNGT